MLKPEQIPDAVIDAAVAMRDRGGSMSDIIRTAINAWPGMHTHEWQRPWLGGMSGTDIILPLTEKTDD